MTKYLISWTEEVWQNVVIEAESREQVRELFYSGEFDIGYRQGNWLDVNSRWELTVDELEEE